MKRLIAFLLLLSFCQTSLAVTKREASLLKAYGLTPGVSLDDIHKGKLDDCEKACAAFRSARGHSVEDKQCGCPESYDPEIAGASIQELSAVLGLPYDRCAFLRDAMIGLKRSEQAAGAKGPPTAKANGSGGIPYGCDPDYPEHHVAYVFWEYGDDGRNGPLIPNSWKDPIEKKGGHWDRWVASYVKHGVLLKRTTDHSKAHIHWQEAYWPSGQIGEAQFPSQRCSTHVYNKCEFSTMTPGSDKAQDLFEHEGGHNLGFGHSNGGTMNATLTGALYWAESTLRLWVQYYGGQPVPVNDQPEPPLPPDNPTKGNVQISIGSEWKMIGENGTVITFKVVSIENDIPENPTLTESISLAIRSIQDYPDKELHQDRLALFLQLVVNAWRNKIITSESEAQKQIEEFAKLALGSNVEQWESVFALVQLANNVDLLEQAALGFEDSAELFERFDRWLDFLEKFFESDRLDRILDLIDLILGRGGESKEAKAKREPAANQPKAIRPKGAKLETRNNRRAA